VQGERVSEIALPGRRSLIRNAVYSLASGSGSLWAAMSNGVVLRIDPRTHRVQNRIRVAAQTIAYGGRALWALTPETHLVRIEPGINEKSGDQPLGVGSGDALTPAGSAVYAAFLPSLSSTTSAVEKLEADSMQRVWSRPVLSPSAIAAGHGAVWVASYLEQKVYRLDAANGRAVQTISVAGAPVGIAVVGDEVWVSIDRPEF
jgi:hypothetical protein